MRVVDVTLKTSSGPGDVNVEKIVRFVREHGKLYTPFYTLDVVRPGELRISTEEYEYILYYASDGTVKREIDEEIFKYLAVGGVSEKFWEFFDGDSVVIYPSGVKVLRAGREVRGRVLQAGGLVFVPDYTRENVYVCRGGDIVLEEMGNFAVVGGRGMKFTVPVGAVNDAVRLLATGDLDAVYRRFFPGVPRDIVNSIMRYNKRKNAVVFFTGKKMGVVLAEVVEGGTKYYGVPYLEGIYNVVVPAGCDCDVFTPLSVRELPKGVKAHRRITATYGRFKDFEKVRVNVEKFEIWFDGVHAVYSPPENRIEVGGKVFKKVPDEMFFNVVSGELDYDGVRVVFGLL